MALRNVIRQKLGGYACLSVLNNRTVSEAASSSSRVVVCAERSRTFASIESPGPCFLCGPGPGEQQLLRGHFLS